MNKLSIEQKATVLRSLVEGNSIRATVRMTGVAKNTIAKLLVEVGEAAAEFHNTTVNHIVSKRVQTDEIWSFVYAKEKNVPQEKRTEVKSAGDVWTWTAIDADTKLIISWFVADRSLESAVTFMKDVRSRLANRVQLTTDGLKNYLVAVDHAFDYQVDYAQLIKMYTGNQDLADIRYSSAECTGTKKTVIQGNPDKEHISTSFVERQNLTMRMHMRRFTRLTNGFSKKIENHMAAIALHFYYYNFVRVHQTLKVTPAMEAGIEKRPLTLEGLISLTKSEKGAEKIS